MQKLSLFACLLFLTVTALAATPAVGQQEGHASEFNPSVWLLYELNDRSRLDLYTGRERSEELNSSKWKVGVGASIRVRPLFNLFDKDDPDKKYTLVLGTVFETSKTTEAGQSRTENKVALDAWGRWAFKRPKILVTDRNRVEFRWVNGDFHLRYRNWLFAERPIMIKKYKVSPFVGAEPFWDQRYKEWNLIRFMGGVRLPVWRRTYMDVFYVREHCRTCSTLNTDVFGINYFIPLRRKKK
jgi:hypothetical protein